MDLSELLSRLAVALGIGLLIGLERGWQTRTAKSGSRAAGIRTFTLCGILGGVIAALAQATGSPLAAAILVGVAFAGFAGVFALFSRDENRAHNSASATTAIAGLLTFALGALTVMGDMRIAAAAGVAVTSLLALRGLLHGLVQRITWDELRSVLVLLAMTFIALPVLPNEAVGPFGGINPREVWLIAIVLAGVSFLGYGAVKAFGAALGILVAAAVGGLVSSTAVTVANARRARQGEGDPILLAAGAGLASAISFVRVAAIVAALNPGLWPAIAPALIAAAAAALLATGIAVRRARAVSAQPVVFSNPFQFWPVLGFAAFLGAVILAGRLAGETFGAAGAIAGAAAVGLADVDSVTVAMTRLVPSPLSAQAAVLAILTAVASNSLVKVALGAILGERRYAVALGAIMGACLVSGGVAFGLTVFVIPA